MGWLLDFLCKMNANLKAETILPRMFCVYYNMKENILFLEFLTCSIPGAAQKMTTSCKNNSLM